MRSVELIVELIAHRGYPRHYPENTLPGIAAALRAGARYLEIDVQLTADRVPVLFHDADLERLCGVPGRVDQYRLSALSALRVAETARFGAAFADVEIPTLSAVTTLLRDWPEVILFVEVKAEPLARFGIEEVYWRVAPVLEDIRRRAVLISFDLDFLAAAERHGWPELGAVVERWEERREVSQHPMLQAIAPRYLFTDIDHLPADGPLRWPHGPLAVYEVADPAVAIGLAARGVDLIETFAIGEMLHALETDSHA